MHAMDNAQYDTETIFEKMRAGFSYAARPTTETQKHKIKKLGRLLVEKQALLLDALRADYGHRSDYETQLLELFPTLEEMGHIHKNCQRWLKPQRKRVSIWFQPGRSEIMRQPLGVVGIVVPWNYPIYLSISPLVGAIAAGNRVMLKMSEQTPQTGIVLAQILSDVFEQEEVAVINGGIEEAQLFCQQPFDHLFFTGSTAVGRLIMREAANHLTPVTLELGGKSPVIISDDYDLEKACDRILMGKCFNAGQTCIAPDYVYVPRNKLDDAIKHFKTLFNKRYPDYIGNKDYSTIINNKQEQRIQALLKDAQALGANVSWADSYQDGLKMPLCCVSDIDEKMQIMQAEIFGPLLPIIPYDDLQTCLDEINRKPRPLALYLFSNCKRTQQRVLTETISGGVTINDTLLHVAQKNLPFGGVGQSGMGHYHGKYTIETFTKAKPIFKQSALSSISLFYPPYTETKQKLLRLLSKGSGI